MDQIAVIDRSSKYIVVCFTFLKGHKVTLFEHRSPLVVFGVDSSCIDFDNTLISLTLLDLSISLSGSWVLLDEDLSPSFLIHTTDDLSFD